MAGREDAQLMASERIAPGMLPKVLNSTDMTIIFLAIVLFIVQASVIQPAGPSAYSYWILGFLLFLIPGALVTAQLGLMFSAGGLPLRLDAEGTRAVLGLLRRLLRLVARRARHGRDLGPRRHYLAVHRQGRAGEAVAANDRDPRGAVVLGGPRVAAAPRHAELREPGGLLLRRRNLRHRPGGRSLAGGRKRLRQLVLSRLELDPGFEQLDVLRPRDPGAARNRGPAEHGRRDRQPALDQALPLLGVPRRHGGVSLGDVRQHGHRSARRQQLDHRRPLRGGDRLLGI